MPLSPELEAALQEEIAVLSKIHASLREQRDRILERHSAEKSRASDLTSEIVATRRVEDKAMLASDEAVSYALRDKFRDDIEILERLIKKPYVARLVVKEDDEKGSRELEYRIGTAANTECRIIDWRKAPISKLYYEYREGDHYSEEIQGREREGTVILRNMVEIEHGLLKKLVCRHGTAVKRGTEWVQVSGARSASAGRDYAALPSVLALITAEQFRTITEDAESAVLIQGVAGSGKTTVALHRLAWLLHEENSELKASESIIVALNPVLRLYIERSLAQLEIKGVAVRTFSEFAANSIHEALPGAVDMMSDGRMIIRRPSTPCPRTVDRVKRSLGVFQAVEERAAAAEQSDPPLEILLSVLTDSKRILELDDSKLLSKEVIEETLARTKQNFEESILDPADDALLLRIYQIQHGCSVMHDGQQGNYRQVVVDEVQEYSPAELAAVIGSVEDLSHLTLVGDVAQQTGGVPAFPGWEKLRTHWDSSGALSQFVTLSVTHRSTAEIMAVGAAVQRTAPPQSSRHGRKPIWFQSRHESRVFARLFAWISRAVELHPGALTAVICRDRAEAKLAYSQLTPTFGSAVRLWDEYSATFDEGVVVTDVEHTKGLEFTNVVIWNPTFKSYPDTPQDRNALYVAITRAEENLCIATWQRQSPLLPSIQSKLVRGNELDLGDEEEQETRS